MSAITRVVPFLLPCLAVACRANPVAQGAPAAPVAPAAAGAPAEKFGVLAPLGAPALSIWPEEYSGAWLALEVLPQGATVKVGDVVARLDARAIDEQLHHAELELQTSELAHRTLLERDQLEEQAAKSALARVGAALARTQRSLDAWKRDEIAFDKRQDELSKRYEQANIEDQTDELGQLEKMYKGDELVDATEDIVLKRSKRGLELTQDQNQLQRDRAKHHQELDLSLQTEQREEDFRAQQEALARLASQQAIEARTRADAEARSADALGEQKQKLERLRQDRAFFELKAPVAGILLHGEARDYRPGKSPARLQRGSSLAARTDLFVIAPEAPAAVAFDVSDAERALYASGAGIEVHALAGDAHAAGKVALDEYPRSLSASETTLEGSATLEQPLAGAHYGERVRVAPARGGS